MKRRIFCLFLLVALTFGVLSSCVTPGGGKTCESCVDTNTDGVCDACGGAVELPEGVHKCTDSDYDTLCDECGAYVTIGNFPWQNTTLKFAMNLHSHSGELSSGSSRYLAGSESDGSELVSSIVARNVKAGLYTKTVIEYDYWLDSDDIYDWNTSHKHILMLVSSDSSSQPDIYSTFLYDMMAASLERCLANLRTTKYLEKESNYFSFARDDKYTENVGDSEGYMMEFMESLTLSPSKMYLLASDYFIDTVRAFFLVPANVDLLNATGVSYKERHGGTLPASGAFKDRTGDGEFTVDDFIELIWDREWTYDAIMEYSTEVYVDSDDTGTKSAKDTLGFVLETGSGFSASGVLYTSSFTIIDKKLIDGEWSFSYPAVTLDEATKSYKYDSALDVNGDVEALIGLEAKVQDLFSSSGVFASSNEIKAVYAQSSDERDLVAIRHKFVGGTLLFGGLIMTGNLEEREFSDMKNNTVGGFAIAPGPLYMPLTEREYHSDSDLSSYNSYTDSRGDVYYTDSDGELMKFRDYTTIMHNVGRLAGVSVNTKKFSQCSAFLDYQSTHSTEILDRYYEEKLTRAAAGTENGNDDVMRFIRNHVRSVFGKAFEDAIAYSYSEDNPAARTWHTLIKANGFQPNAEIGTNYSTLAVEKQKCLMELAGDYENLPDLKDPNR